MNLKPCKNNLLVKFFPPSGTTIIIPDNASAPVDGEHRVKCKILDVSETLDPKYGKLLPGQFILTPPRFNYLQVDKANFTALINADAIEAIVLDDTEPDAKPNLTVVS